MGDRSLPALWLPKVRYLLVNQVRFRGGFEQEHQVETRVEQQYFCNYLSGSRNFLEYAAGRVDYSLVLVVFLGLVWLWCL